MGYTHKQTQGYERTTFNKGSGELVADEFVVETRKSSFAINFSAPWGSVSNATWQVMALMKFTTADLCLIAHFMEIRSTTDHGLIVVGTKEQLAEASGVKLRSLHRSLKKLLDSGLLLQPDEHSYRWNPRYVFNGGGEAHFHARSRVPRDTPDLFPLTSYGKARTPSWNKSDKPRPRSRRAPRRNAA